MILVPFRVASQAVAQRWGGELGCVGSGRSQHALDVSSRVLFAAASGSGCAGTERGQVPKQLTWWIWDPEHFPLCVTRGQGGVGRQGSGMPRR